MADKNNESGNRSPENQKALDNLNRLQSRLPEKYVEHMNETGLQLAENLRNNGWEERMNDAFGGSAGKTVTMFNKILNRLETPAIYNGKKVQKHHYLENRSEPVQGLAGGYPYVGVSREIYTTDIAFINKELSLPGLSPEQQNVLLELRDTLLTYANNDPGRRVKQFYADRRSNNYSDQVVTQMGKVALIGALGAYTIATGIISIAQRKFSIAPFASGIAVYLLAYPDAWDSLTGGPYHAAKEQLRKSVTADTDRVTKKYGIKGPIWATIQRRHMRPDEPIIAFQKKIANGTASAEDKKEFASLIIDGNANRNIHNKFLELLENEEDYKIFSEVQKVRDPYAQRALLTQTEMGKEKYNQEGQRVLESIA